MFAIWFNNEVELKNQFSGYKKGINRESVTNKNGQSPFRLFLNTWPKKFFDHRLLYASLTRKNVRTCWIFYLYNSSSCLFVSVLFAQLVTPFEAWPPFCYFYLVSKSSRISSQEKLDKLPSSLLLELRPTNVSNKNKSVLNYNWSLIFLNISCVLVFRWHSGLKNQENVSWTHFQHLIQFMIQNDLNWENETFWLI